MTVFNLRYLLSGLKERNTRPADFAAAVLRLSAREREALQNRARSLERKGESSKPAEKT